MSFRSRRLRERMRLPPEDALEIEVRLREAPPEEAARFGQILLDLAAREVIEHGEQRIDHQQDGQRVVNGHHQTEIGPAKLIGTVDDDAGGNEQQDDTMACVQCQSRS